MLDADERQSSWPIGVAAFFSIMSVGVLRHWMPIYVAAGAAYGVCFACAGAYLTRGRRRNAGFLIVAILGGVFAAAVYYLWP